MSSILSFSNSVKSNIKKQNVVFTAPTGAGKSTLLPQWLRVCGRVLVIEPRRLAAQALASRVASLDGTSLGDVIGYQVRDSSRWGQDTEILYVTTGIALRFIASGKLKDFDVIILDEFHERSLDLELLLALLLHHKQRILVCSATLAAQKITDHINGVWIHADQRPFDVDIIHVGGNRLPSDENLGQRIKQAIFECGYDWKCLLVFLPGKSEIRRCASALSSTDYEILTLNGSQSLEQQNCVFEPLGKAPRVVLSTNIAETSLTIPQVDGVIDSGLVRRTRYYGGRGFLTLLPIALDSAQQRSGRAGRTKAGFAVRLWADSHGLKTHTIPEIRRDSLTQLLLASLCCGFHPNELPFLEPPPKYALEHAESQLFSLGALNGNGSLTELGQSLFRFPLGPFLNRLIIQAQKDGTLLPILHVCSVLSTQRAFFCGRGAEPEKDIRREGCDLIGLLRATALSRCPKEQVHQAAWDGSKRILQRLKQVFKVSELRDWDIDMVRRTILRAWPDAAHVRRQRKRNIAWANGGTEKSLSHSSAIQVDKSEVILSLATVALSGKRHHAEAMITLATPIESRTLFTEGRTRAVLERVQVDGEDINCVYTHRYAKRVILQVEAKPPPELVIPSIVQAILEGRWHPEGAEKLRQNYSDRSLAAELAGESSWPNLTDWLTNRFVELGVVEIADLELLDDADWCPDELDSYYKRQLRRKYPASLSTGDAIYELKYEPSDHCCFVIQQSGFRKVPPDRKNLPRLRGWRFIWVYKNRSVPIS